MYTKGEWEREYGLPGTNEKFILCNGEQIALVYGEANAQLIASAPRLLGELKTAATTIHNMIRGTEGGYRESLQAQLKEILEAIAKAESK